MPIIDTSNLTGRHLVTSKPEDIPRICVKIVEASDSQDKDLNSNPELKDFIVTSKDDTEENIMSYNEILDNTQNKDDQHQIE